MTTRDIIAAIDAATGCQQCTGPLGDSPSADFCSATCQADWSAARTTPLDGYVEPDDLPAHVANTVELHSAETCTLCAEGAPAAHRWLPDTMWGSLVARAAQFRGSPFPEVDDVDTVRIRPGTNPFADRLRATLDAAMLERGRWWEASNVVRVWPGIATIRDDVFEVSTPFGSDASPAEQLATLINRGQVFTAPAGTPPPDGEPGEPWVPAELWERSRVPWPTFRLTGQPAVPLALVVDELPRANFEVRSDGSMSVVSVAPGIALAELRHPDGETVRVVGVDPSGHVIVSAGPHHVVCTEHVVDSRQAVPDVMPFEEHLGAGFARFADRVEATARVIGPVMADAFRMAVRALDQLAPLLHDQPPTEPRARALWLRQHRGTGPQRQQRAPRTINARRSR
ncbi:hypothetical protein [Saccharothrix lopnurensis]|uniref:Uncharacterized protein n=1 Tax=Saccharothrix lopnurensis TaxID=1670621 RepID=A0ABW1P5Z7_9PSEU